MFRLTHDFARDFQPNFKQTYTSNLVKRCFYKTYTFQNKCLVQDSSPCQRTEADTVRWPTTL